MNNAELSIAMLRDIEARLIELENQWRHIDKRIATLEENGGDVRMNVEHSNRINEIAQRQELELRITELEKKLWQKITRHGERIGALEDDKNYYFGLAGMFEEQTKRIAAIDGTVSNLMVTAENLYRRIAALEANK